MNHVAIPLEQLLKLRLIKALNGQMPDKHFNLSVLQTPVPIQIRSLEEDLHKLLFANTSCIEQVNCHPHEFVKIQNSEVFRLIDGFQFFQGMLEGYVVRLLSRSIELLLSEVQCAVKSNSYVVIVVVTMKLDTHGVLLFPEFKKITV
ncbi:MAG: hypothetical protein V2I33_20030 [Kangiellaceae bacterium]|jgi:hypothetical protein|nr:hypothetical protein [Kangiellaceae bacterium]